MSMRIAVVVGVALLALPLLAVGQGVVPFDQWHGAVSGQVESAAGSVVALGDGRVYRYRRALLEDVLLPGD